MNFLMILLVSGLLLHDTTAVTHSMKYFYMASSGVPDFPEFVAVGMVDDVQMFHYDSNTEKAEPKQDWMSRVTEEVPQYWEWNTGNSLGTQQLFKANIQTAKQRFNQTEGAHILQQMVGCEFDDETKEVKGFDQFGYDGEDFLVLDLKTLTWTAPREEAVITKQRWDKDETQTRMSENYFNTECIEWLKKYVNYGQSSLMRTDLPSVSLLQKSPSSPVSCHASGFYPNSAMMFWRKDGEELQEDVEVGEIIPNHDGSFQMSVDLLKLPSDDWGRYECVFQLAGVKEDQVTKLDKYRIRTNYENPTYMIILIVAGLILLSTVLCVAGFFIHKQREVKPPPSPSVSTSAKEEEDVMIQKG
ncbi:BOLA class I histocompatibility antigen, alpha chain BL3-6-like [Halichoeres trimaculatus]|uniref:BOLA class I histocompatibility antigen, alpha chain BL3-6-like n=1 Tax=Halichoeres trimaculatus TaxID=147232 RepID=UPI003D9ECAEB